MARWQQEVEISGRCGDVGWIGYKERCGVFLASGRAGCKCNAVAFADAVLDLGGSKIWTCRRERRNPFGGLAGNLGCGAWARPISFRLAATQRFLHPGL